MPPWTGPTECGSHAANRGCPTPGWRRRSPAWPGTAWCWIAAPSTVGAGAHRPCRPPACGELLPLQRSWIGPRITRSMTWHSGHPGPTIGKVPCWLLGPSLVERVAARRDVLEPLAAVVLAAGARCVQCTIDLGSYAPSVRTGLLGHVQSACTSSIAIRVLFRKGIVPFVTFGRQTSALGGHHGGFQWGFLSWDCAIGKHTFSTKMGQYNTHDYPTSCPRHQPPPAGGIS